MAEQQPDIQLIANLVVLRPDGNVLFVRYHADDERWWLPGEDLEPYEHPDERARQRTVLVRQANGKVLTGADGVRIPFGHELERKTEKSIALRVARRSLQHEAFGAAGMSASPAASRPQASRAATFRRTGSRRTSCRARCTASGNGSG